MAEGLLRMKKNNIINWRMMHMITIEIPDEIEKDLAEIRSKGETMLDVIKRLIMAYDLNGGARSEF